MKVQDFGSWRKYINKANAKKVLNGIRIALVVVLILAELLAYIDLNNTEVKFYLDDFGKIYKEQLDIVFGDEYEIGPRQVVTEYDPPETKGPPSLHIYYTWKIKYRDRYGDEYTVLLSNEDAEDFDFPWEVYRWMSDQAEQHFIKAYHKAEYSENMGYEYLLEVDPENDEHGARVRSVRYDDYDAFADSDKLPHLYEMRYEDWFVEHPEFFSAVVYYNNRCDEMINDIVEGLAGETDGNFNLRIKIVYDRDLSIRIKRKYIYYVMGEAREFEDRDEYESALYQEYETMGMFD